MAVSVSYGEGGRLTLSGLQCDCACQHGAVDKDIYIGKGLIGRVPEFVRHAGLGTHCVLVADDVTYRVAGHAVESALVGAGFDVTACVLHREGETLPDDGACGEVLLSITQQTEFLVSVGSGTVTDIVRINAARTGLKFVSVATAPSMDGYASAVAPLLHRGVKIQRPAVCPDVIVCDLDVLSTAPMEMIASGVGDVLGKYIAKVDWQLGQIVNGEAYCPVCAGIVMDAVNALVQNVEEIAARTEKGMQVLIEALLLSGVTIMIIGHTRAVASVEHNIAQYWEMMMILRGEKPPMHGASVGVATLLVWPFYERFAREDLTALNLDAIRANRISRKERERWMRYAFGEEGGRQIMRENPEDFLSWEEQERRIRTVQQRADDIRAVLAQLPPAQEIRRVLTILGGETTPQQEHIPQDLLNLSMWCGKDYRTRYTLMKTLEECGLLEAYLSDYPRPVLPEDGSAR
ncbi:MAG TPA: sn-glycerol-1-phosphate dehydrogenase [Candidatus Aphodomonas merdavium]|nr:sn-glycerol-1-phosphate dehydrogenase [Candidatus Aphodomonas merdavium]